MSVRLRFPYKLDRFSRDAARDTKYEIGNAARTVQRNLSRTYYTDGTQTEMRISLRTFLPVEILQIYHIYMRDEVRILMTSTRV